MAYGGPATRATFKVVVTQDTDVLRRFRELGYRTKDLSEVFGRIAQEVTHDARSLAPTASGQLLSSIRPTKAKYSATVAAGYKRTPYAGPIEYGWRNRGIEPHPFLRPAADTKADWAAEQIGAEMRRLIHLADLG